MKETNSRLVVTATSIAAAVVPVAVLLVVAERPVSAYIDPGTGSYVTQIIVASIVSAGFVLRSYWSRVKDTWRRRFGPRG